MFLKKLLAFFDSDVLQLFDFEARPYRSNGSISAACTLGHIETTATEAGHQQAIEFGEEVAGQITEGTTKSLAAAASKASERSRRQSIPVDYPWLHVY